MPRGDTGEDCETMVPRQALLAACHTVHAVAPDSPTSRPANACRPRSTISRLRGPAAGNRAPASRSTPRSPTYVSRPAMRGSSTAAVPRVPAHERAGGADQAPLPRRGQAAGGAVPRGAAARGHGAAQGAQGVGVSGGPGRGGACRRRVAGHRGREPKRSAKRRCRRRVGPTALPAPTAAPPPAPASSAALCPAGSAAAASTSAA
jgi:hypothetical protein